MRRKGWIVSIITVMLMTGCYDMENNGYAIHNEVDTFSTECEDTVRDAALQNDELLEADDIISQITFITDECDEWTRSLQEKNELVADFNKDLVEDNIQIVYEEKEGAKYIDRFQFSLGGNEYPFVIDDYDASFQKIEIIDIDQDGNDELVIVFDTHGGGGQGTHDLYIIRLNTDEILAKKINTIDTSSLKMDSTWNIDDIYDIDKIEFNGNEKLLVRQYVWGENGHSDMIGNLISIVSFNNELNIFLPEKSWMEYI